MQTLERNNRGITEFTKLVEQMKKQNVFKGHVYGPLATAIKLVPGMPPHAATALENCVKRRVWSAFVVEHGSDQALLLKCVCGAVPNSY
jgi:hypothetical protein